jgi:hypothetical protein
MNKDSISWAHESVSNLFSGIKNAERSDCYKKEYISLSLNDSTKLIDFLRSEIESIGTDYIDKKYYERTGEILEHHYVVELLKSERQYIDFVSSQFDLSQYTENPKLEIAARILGQAWKYQGVYKNHYSYEREKQRKEEIECTGLINAKLETEFYINQQNYDKIIDFLYDLSVSYNIALHDNYQCIYNIYCECGCEDEKDDGHYEYESWVTDWEIYE